MRCPNCSETLDNNDYEGKISDHSTEAIKTLLSLYTAALGLYVTIIAVYFGFRVSQSASDEHINLIRFFLCGLSVFLILFTWLFRWAVDFLFVMYKRNMVALAGKRSDELLSGIVSKLLTLGKASAVAITLFIAFAIIVILQV